MALNDTKHATLLTRLSESSGNLQDLELQWLQAQAGVTAGNIIDAWMEYIATQGAFTQPNFTDRAKAWLGSLGHTQDNIAERWDAYWTAG